MSHAVAGATQVTSRERRYRTTSVPFYTNDPYFQGFAPNFELAPFATSSSVPGQWDMHAIGLEHAYGYALGSSSIKIAIIDTGEDASHPDLSGKIAHQHCFITNAAGTSQSTGNFSTDEDGHGTDVSGIAAAATGNALGFSGAGGLSVIYAYRVFPTPDDNCASDGSNDAQCSADTADIASAINDAVAQGVNIISMSLGGGSCTNGVDSDTVEGTAVTNALAHNVIVVAASGNSAIGQRERSGMYRGRDRRRSDLACRRCSVPERAATTRPRRTGTASSSNIVEYVTSYTANRQPGREPAQLHGVGHRGAGRRSREW